MRPAAIYSRYSTDKQDARSIEDQVRRCRAFAEQRGWNVISEYADAAMSGSHTDRINLQRLLRDADRREFELVLVDDLSRLSRDLGATWRIIFEDLAARRVSVVDCTTGRASNEPGARLIFGALGLVNDTYLELIRTETHRGLEGRAIAGFATGGRTYGFKTVPEPNPTDPTHPRKIRLVHPEESVIVARIFEQYAQGLGTKEIAARLNADGISAPHDGGRGNKLSKGWGHTTIRHMLRNENYIGLFVWNRHKFEQIPGTNKYRHVPRPENEHVRKAIPDLRIISDDLWQRAQGLIGKKRGPYSPRTGTGRPRGNLFAGLLRCGICGGAISVVGQHTERSGETKTRYTTLGCGVRASRGEAICSNGRSISALRLNAEVLRCLKDLLSAPDVSDRIHAGIRAKYARPKPSRAKELESAISAAEAKIRNLTHAIGEMGFSPSLAAGLREAEARLAQLQADARAGSKELVSNVVPLPSAVSGLVSQVLAQLDDVATDEGQGFRALLRQFMPPIVLTPAENGAWKISGGFDFAGLLATEQRKLLGLNSRRDRD